ncbi:P2X purinoceptor 7-like isoform X1 [Ixodes scapularis]|uniref:P2X purinoceptor 7-like isoform X1 n=1 Tax=Ixodes scapularis TaxID=6945 RepID=UPI00116170DA|nr:P2X purinoceptor 7-like isoform X1 [Ixodes scapularis]
MAIEGFQCHYASPTADPRRNLSNARTVVKGPGPKLPGLCAQHSSFVASHGRAMDLSDLTSLELEILERTADMGAISYDSTPMRDVDERSAAGTDCGNDQRPRRGEASPQELEDAPDDGIGRLGNTDWCLCGSCAPMETVVECVCCREYPAVARKQQGRQGCVTGHPDFEALCLNPEVLRLAYLNMRHYGQQGMGASASEHYRFAAYRQCALWLWSRLGKKNRRLLPSCLVKTIRGRYPADVYAGYRDAE